MKVIVCNNYTPVGDWIEFGGRVSKIMDDYANSNGYERRCITHRVSDTKWMGWDKIKLCIDTIQDCDVLFCLDTDLFIMNHNVTVESFLDYENDIYIPRDRDNINVGVIILKNTEFVRQFLNDVWEMRNEIPDEFQSEQNAWWHVMNKYGLIKMKILNQKGINSYPYNDETFVKRFGRVEDESQFFKRRYDPSIQPHYGNFTTGDFILHMPGINMKRRFEYLNMYEDKIIKKYD
jgi:Protein of unknown function, DUF273